MGITEYPPQIDIQIDIQKYVLIIIFTIFPRIYFEGGK
jgi:hypothetical protein